MDRLAEIERKVARSLALDSHEEAWLVREVKRLRQEIVDCPEYGYLPHSTVYDDDLHSTAEAPELGRGGREVSINTSPVDMIVETPYGSKVVRPGESITVDYGPEVSPRTADLGSAGPPFTVAYSEVEKHRMGLVHDVGRCGLEHR